MTLKKKAFENIVRKEKGVKKKKKKRRSVNS